LWGGFSVENPTLNRFFTLHFLLPFIIAGLSLLHILFLHIPGSSNPLTIKTSYDKISFYPYFYLKDLYGLIIIFLIFFFIVFFFPNILGHSDNFIRANSLVTPASIVPE
jgi:ubiquinol-cytochrome c reductase cytochrome b subunit